MGPQCPPTSPPSPSMAPVDVAPDPCRHHSRAGSVVGWSMPPLELRPLHAWALTAVAAHLCRIYGQSQPLACPSAALSLDPGEETHLQVPLVRAPPSARACCRRLRWKGGATGVLLQCPKGGAPGVWLRRLEGVRSERERERGVEKDGRKPKSGAYIWEIQRKP